mgnify:CR=1 FL=1
MCSLVIAIGQGLAQRRGFVDADAQGLQARIAEQIAALERTQELLGACIGCGCLSLKKCGLYNREDKAAQRGAGPRYLLGDRWGEIAEV